MSARGEIQEVDMDTGAVLLVDGEGRTIHSTIDQLSRAELVKAYAFVLPGSGRGIMFTNDELRHALRTGTRAELANREQPADSGEQPADEWAEHYAPQEQSPELERLIEDNLEDVDGSDAEREQQEQQIIEEARQKVEQEQRQKLEQQEQKSEPAAGNVEQGLIDRIVYDIARVAAGTALNEERVREIAREESALRYVTRIELKGKEPRELEGTFHPVFSRLLSIVNRGVHVYLTGPAGTGKSTLAEQVADALDIPFASISCHPQMTGTALFGYQTADGVYMRTQWREIFEHGGVFCVDEMDNANSSLMSALNQSLANSIAAFPDGMVRRSSDIPTIVVGTGNTHGTGPDALYVGRQAQDGALRTRFYTLEVPIDEKLERMMIDRTGLAAGDGDEWHTIVKKARECVETLGMRIIVSPRHAMLGAEGMCAGDSLEQAIHATFLAGVPSEQAQKIREWAKF